MPSPVEGGVRHRHAQAAHQRRDVVDRDVGAQDPGGLGAADELRGQRVELLAASPACTTAGPRRTIASRSPASAAMTSALRRRAEAKASHGSSISSAARMFSLVTRNFSRTSASMSASFVGKWR